MKSSDFNVWTQLGEDIHLLYNTRTNALLKLTPEKRQQAETFFSHPEKHSENEFEKELVRLGFVVPDGTDELSLLKTAERANRFGNRNLGLTLCTTLACNLRCVYCYQKKSSSLMPRPIQQKIVDYVESQTPGLTGLHVVYFGGEPLVGQRVIQYLAGEFQRLSGEKGFTYSAGIITNGYLLTGEIAKELAGYGVESGQVTLDGPKNIHDTRRPQENGKGSYDRILENLGAAVEHIGKMSVRVNIDKNNISAIPELLDDLDKAGLRGKVNLYFGLVDNVTEACKDYGCHCFSKEQYAKELTQLQITCLQRGYVIDNFPDGGMGCGAISLSSYVVAPDGKLFKCYNQTGVEGEDVGHIDGQLDESRLSRWLSYDIFEHEKCKGCTTLPLCLGECPQQAVEAGEPECPSIHYGLQDTLKMTLLNTRYRQSQSELVKGERSP